MIMLLMPVCHSYLSLTVSSAWRAQLDNECGKAPVQRDRPHAAWRLTAISAHSCTSDAHLTSNSRRTRG